MPDSVFVWLQYLLGGGGLGAVIMGFRALMRGKKEDKELELQLQEKVVTMAERWLGLAETRLKKAEEAAAEAEKKIDWLHDELDTCVEEVLKVYRWIDGGAKPPPPERPKWLEGAPKKGNNA